MRRVLQPGHTPRPLHEYATKKSWPHFSHRARANPCASMPHSKNFRRSRSTYAGTGSTTQSAPASSPPARRRASHVSRFCCTTWYATLRFSASCAAAFLSVSFAVSRSQHLQAAGRRRTRNSNERTQRCIVANFHRHSQKARRPNLTADKTHAYEFVSDLAGESGFVFHFGIGGH